MAFEKKNLSIIAYANGFTLWHYSTPDQIIEVDASGYFNEMKDVMRKGDIILANCDIEGLYSTMIAAVHVNDGTTVDLADGYQFGSTNTL